MIYNFEEYNLNERLGVNQVVQHVVNIVWEDIKDKKFYFRKKYKTSELPEPFNKLYQLKIVYNKYGKEGNHCYFSHDYRGSVAIINLKELKKGLLAHELNHAHDFIIFNEMDMELSDNATGIFDFSNLDNNYKISLNYFMYIYSNDEMNSRIIETYNDLSRLDINNKEDFIRELNKTYSYEFYKDSFKFYMKIFYNIISDKEYRLEYINNLEANDTFKIDEDILSKECKKLMKFLVSKNNKILKRFHKLYDMVINPS